MEQLQPCPHRTIDQEGRILCDEVTEGEREVTLHACSICPVSQINCAHLRAALLHSSRPPIHVRYFSGKIEIWDAEPPTLSVRRAACAARALPLSSTRDCTGCTLRQAPCFAAISRTHARAHTVRKSRRATPVVQDAPRPATNKILRLNRWLPREQAHASPSSSVAQPTPSADVATWSSSYESKHAG